MQCTRVLPRPASTRLFTWVRLHRQVEPDKKIKPKKGARKVQLKPGHSLAHWVERMKSGEDMTGGAGNSQTRLITPEEMARHRTAGDAWMAIRGKVYNITKYLDYHPGGIDILMDEAGKEATKLFDENHRWVNIERLLGPCQVGVLKTLSLAI
ncbi:cytochrome b5 reductase 4-like isoform X2 [Paramacrobiotus metropolitanus]|uniref:cytochrome b5 reductase 4-like isoform X2 n=1 Tax=Paramacrobiotus metropolitanus TaxID=2943436 RepID=UPI0024458A44|nr:cytochrome b5 reductase 4-like isoform X2 [Paramacrobiotus metropolitanus]